MEERMEGSSGRQTRFFRAWKHFLGSVRLSVASSTRRRHLAFSLYRKEPRLRVRVRVADPCFTVLASTYGSRTKLRRGKEVFIMYLLNTLPPDYRHTFSKREHTCTLTDGRLVFILR